MAASNVRVRFAPSPTGFLHVGGARTALYNWLYARHTGGTFVFRVEDTDQERSTEASLQMQLTDVNWLGLKWDEGPGVGGPYGPYKQSERRHIYAEHSERLLQSGKAYYCFCKDDELEQKKAAAIKAGRPPHYDGKCRKVTLDEAKGRLAAGEKGAIRFRIGDHKDYVLNDLIRGQVTFPAGMVGDFIVLRSDGFPVYNFCCVIDDALMKITHVLRAEEHLSNTVRQMMLYEAFGYELPQFGHLSIILGADKQKLSKRHGATSCNEFMKQGFLPEVMNNFLALLGWSSPKAQEIMCTSEMIEQFGLDRFTSSPAVFDEVKLKWMNSVHLRALPHGELWNRIVPFLEEAGLHVSEHPEWNDVQWQDRALGALKTSMELLKDAVPLFDLLSDKKFAVQSEAAEAMAWESTPSVIRAWRDELASMSQDFLTEAEFLAVQDRVKDKANAKGKHLFMAIRVAVIGKPHGTELKQLVPLIPRKSLVLRADKTLRN